MAKAPLEGIRVIDFCQLWAGNFCCAQLADMGAEVIKVESVHFWQYGCRGFTVRPTLEQVAHQVQGGGYRDRDPGERPWERYASFHGHARNKLSATIDLRRPKGVEVFKRLAAVSDVVIDGNTPDVVEKLGIDYPRLREVKEDIIMVRMPGYGLSGPYRNFPALAMNLEAISGHTLLRGYTDSDPSTTTQVVISDAAAGAGAFVSAMMALYHRARTGEGQMIELAQVENFIPFMAQAVMDAVMNGRVQGTLGNRSPSAAPCGLYPAQGQDRWVNITVHDDGEWAGLCRALGEPEWARDPKFGDVLSRYRNQDELDTHLSEWTRGREAYEVMHLLQREGVPAGPIIDPPRAFTDPHLRERGFFQEMRHPEVGSYLTPRILWPLPGTPLRIRHPAPLMGQHNEYVYKTLLGFSEEEYAELEREGYIGTEPGPEIS